MVYDTGICGRRTLMVAEGISDRLTVLRQVQRYLTVQRLADQSGQFVINLLAGEPEIR